MARWWLECYWLILEECTSRLLVTKRVNILHMSHEHKWTFFFVKCYLNSWYAKLLFRDWTKWFATLDVYRLSPLAMSKITRNDIKRSPGDFFIVLFNSGVGLLDFYGFRFVSFGLAGNVVKCTLLAEHVSGRRSSASGVQGRRRPCRESERRSPPEAYDTF